LIIILSSFIHAGMSGERAVVNGTNGQGREGTAVDEKCSRVMEDRGNGWRGNGNKRTSKPDVFIMGAMPNNN
jgi:hypothetical protein